MQAACIVPGGQGGRRRPRGWSPKLALSDKPWLFKAGPQPECFWGGSHLRSTGRDLQSRVLTEDLAPWAVGLGT